MELRLSFRSGNPLYRLQIPKDSTWPTNDPPNCADADNAKQS